MNITLKYMDMELDGLMNTDNTFNMYVYMYFPI